MGDAQVQMFLSIFEREGYGFGGYTDAFKYIQDDGLSWFELRDAPSYEAQTQCVSGNPSQLLAEYVIAYLSLPAGEDLTSAMIDAGVGDVVDDLYPEYTPSSEVVGDMADAHCGIAAGESAGLDVTAARATLQKGKYASATVEGYDCAGHCRTECACSSEKGRCLAPWRGDVAPGGGVGGTGGGTAAGGSAGSGGTAGGSAGPGPTGGAAGVGAQGGTNPTSSGGSANSAADPAPMTGGGGCGCRMATRDASLPVLLASLLGLGLMQRRRRR